MKKYFFISLLFVLASPQLLGQNSFIDSLIDESFRLVQINVDSSILLSQYALKESKKQSYEYGIANAHARVSIGLRYKGEYDEAIKQADTAILLAKNKFKNIEASALNNKGVCSRFKGEYDKALAYYLAAMDIYTANADTGMQATLYNNIGIMFMNSDSPEKAFSYYEKAEKLQEELDNQKGLADVYNNYAILYANSGDLEKSLTYFQKSLQIEKDLKNKRGITESYGNIGLVYYLQGDLDKAIEITEESIELDREMGNIQGEIVGYNNIADILNEQGKTGEALRYLEKSLAIALRIDSHEDIAAAYLNIAGSHERNGNFEEAFKVYIKFHNQEDSAKSYAQQEKIAEMETKFRTKEKEQLIQIQNLSLLEQESTIRLKKNQIIALMITVISLIIISFLFYLFYKSKKQKELKDAIIVEQEKGLEAVFVAQEEERKRISKDLHDGVGQQLSGLKMGFQKVSKRLEQDNPERSEELNKLSSILSESADEVRSISHQMMPKALTDLGLIEAVEDMLEKSFSLSDINYEFDHFGLENRLKEQIEVSLYRIAQELINNIIKHSNANKVSVQLFKNQGKVILIVEDNGTGIEDKKHDGQGLLNLKSRVNSINGDINLEPSPQSGTLATIRVPI